MDHLPVDYQREQEPFAPKPSRQMLPGRPNHNHPDPHPGLPPFGRTVG